MPARNPAFSFFYLALVFLLPSMVLAKTTVEDYGSLPTISLVKVSPSGKLIVFRKNTPGQDVAVVYSVEQKKVVSIVDVGGIRPDDIYFADNNRIIMRVSKEMRIVSYRGRHDVSTAFVYDISRNEISQLLTPGDNIYLGQTGLGRIVAFDEKKEYAFMPAFIGERIDQSPNMALMKVELDSPRHPHVHDRGNSNTLSYFVRSDGHILAREDYDNRTNEHSILVRKNKKWVPIYEEKSELIGIDVAGLTPDYSSLVVLGSNDESDRVSYYTMSLADGEIHATEFTRIDADIEDTIKDKNGVVFGVKYSGLMPSYRFFDPKLDQKMKDIAARFEGHSVALRDWSDDWKHLVIYVAGSTTSGDFYLFSEGEQPKFLAGAYPNIASEDVNPIGTVQYKARDGLVIPTLVTIPKEKVSQMKNLPAVILPHGGPELHDTVGFDIMAQAFANEGYLVIQPQFRGSSGFGVSHREAGHGEWGKKMQDDLTDAVEFFKDKGMIDPKRVCIVGASYGGYAALAGGAFTPELYRCVVSISGVSDIPAMMSSEKSEHGRDHWVVSYWEKVIAEGKGGKDFMESVSPANFADNFQAPVLLLHGEKDKTVPYKQSKIMYKKLKKAHKSVELVKLEDENHHLMNRETRIQTLKNAIAFVNKNLKM